VSNYASNVRATDLLTPLCRLLESYFRLYLEFRVWQKPNL
jgi:hypothetical protein